MLACDIDLNFTFISCGWEGSATDTKALISSLNNGFQVPEGKFFLVGGGYANTPSFLAPYRGVRYHLKEFQSGQRRPRNYKELFNLRHAILRNRDSFGVFEKTIPYPQSWYISSHREPSQDTGSCCGFS
uniref:DDE Tnp4 domain-containing protein n=1 Tax=Hordeum vulgare subsp. vulgare TaxID=112509 RepID=A0A8I6Z249_HORVV